MSRIVLLTGRGRPAVRQHHSQICVGCAASAGGENPRGRPELGSGLCAQLMVNAGYLNYCDYAGMHPYGYSVSEVIERATEAAKIYGSKPLILSEWNVRGATSPAQWVSELEQIAPALKKVSDEAFYFCLMKCDTMAGPGGLITPTFTPNGPFFDWYQSAAAE